MSDHPSNGWNGLSSPEMFSPKLLKTVNPHDFWEQLSAFQQPSNYVKTASEGIPNFLGCWNVDMSHEEARLPVSSERQYRVETSAVVTRSAFQK